MSVVKVVKLDADGADWAEVSQYVSLVSPERRERIERRRSERDKTVLLLSELLLRREAAEITGEDERKIAFEYNRFGKPFLKGMPDIFFSLSHCGGCIAVVFGGGPIGIDTERIRRMRRVTAERFFTDGERRSIAESKDPDTQFFRIWTAKEAYLKMLGAGLSKPLGSFDVLSEELKGSFLTAENSGYVITVCRRNAGHDRLEIKEKGYGEILYR